LLKKLSASMASVTLRYVTVSKCNSAVCYCEQV
jgi:hypothetical protein